LPEEGVALVCWFAGLLVCWLMLPLSGSLMIGSPGRRKRGLRCSFGLRRLLCFWYAWRGYSHWSDDLAHEGALVVKRFKTEISKCLPVDSRHAPLYMERFSFAVLNCIYIAILPPAHPSPTAGKNCVNSGQMGQGCRLLGVA